MLAWQITRCMHLIGWRFALTARGTCRARAVDHFLPGRLKKVVHENVSFRSVYNGQLQLCMSLLCAMGAPFLFWGK
jgi:hypothetical protein